MSDHLRPYQILAVDAVEKIWKIANETMLDMATGLGKTIIFLELLSRAKAQGKRGLVLTDRRDLAFQAQQKGGKFTNLNIEIEMGEHRARRDLFRSCDVLVSSFQSQTPGRRSKADEFDVIIVDECHGVKAKNKQWMEPIEYYRTGNPNLKILGVTATPEPDCLKYFKTVAFAYNVLDGIKDGYLVNVDQKVAHILSLDFSHVRSRCGDLVATDLSRIMEEEKSLHKIAQVTLEVMFRVPENCLFNLPVDKWGEFLFANGKPMKNLIFCSSVNHARMFSDILNRVHKGLCDWVASDKQLCTEERRKEVSDAFAEGDLLACCNMGIFTKGYDNPRIEQITNARPTESTTWYRQAIGRGTRVLPGVIDGILDATLRLEAIAASNKKSLVVLDLVGNAAKHDLISAVDVFGEKASNDVRKRAREISQKSAKPVPIADLLKTADEQLKAEKLAREEARKKQEAIDAQRKNHIIGKTTHVLNNVSPFEKHEFERPNYYQRKNSKPIPDWLRDKIRTVAGEDPDNVTYGSAFAWWKKHKQEHANDPMTPKQIGWFKWKKLPYVGLNKAQAVAFRNKWEKEQLQKATPPMPAYTIPKQTAFTEGPPLDYYDEVPA